MKLLQLAMISLLTAALAAPAIAQPGPGMGPGQGRGFAFGQGNTAGWSLMTAEERAAHRDKMLAAKTYEECKAIQAEHHEAMAKRARDTGIGLPEPRQSGCDRMRARGLFK
jgi:hypothetical protein